MKSILSLLILIFFNITIVYSQILTVGEVEQEQTEWCWAGVTKCIVDYYGDTTEQCEIAEYTRNTATWHNFGSSDCCNNPLQGCNYWNYGYGTSGSVKEILIFFSGAYNYGTNNTLSKSFIDTELANGRPFVIRWGWTSGGGHFVVGYGKSSNTIYYMNPWYGEGKKFADYDWVVNDGNHEWTHTNVLTTNPTTISKVNNDNNTFKITPNPSDGSAILYFDKPINTTSKLSIYDISGKTVFEKKINAPIKNISLNLELNKGLYFVKIANNKNTLIRKLFIY